MEVQTVENTIFSVLNLSPESSADRVKKKCQEMLLKLHPDKNAGNENPEYQQVMKSKSKNEIRKTKSIGYSLVLCYKTTCHSKGNLY
jgi:DnaJ-class molecular chaperone